MRPTENGARRGDVTEGEGYPIKWRQCRQGHHVLRRLRSLFWDFPRPQSLAPLNKSTQSDVTMKTLWGRQECLLLPERASNIDSTTVLMGKGGRIRCMIKPRVTELTCWSYFHFVQLNTITSALAEFFSLASCFLRSKKIISPSTKEDYSPSYYLGQVGMNPVDLQNESLINK